ncbi:MAG TPA: type I-B CRISPR-associated protein Cas7/Csh2 [Synergistaceae bacterium]|jgi:CRISPR-associated protein Csh2|nr:MAG: CRISPR-associated protein, Csh2 family [Synergistales bacterium 54_9]HAA47503.1 type I-B CRISPR-associated protein Cas7/Csh2 [Synergistaceae bacterium]
MAFEKRREMVFVYSVKDANPNGDPLNANHPRFDEDSGQILVSDVRIKRTIRDQWIRQGKEVFVDGKPKTLKTRIDELKKQFNVNTGKEALAQCIDTRLFGVTFALGKESFSWTGPVQWKWGRSLHRAKAEMVQGTAAFSTKDESDQRSFRNEYIVPFVLLASYAIANQFASEETGAMDEDLDDHFEAAWTGPENLITRSKVGHKSRLFMEVTYKKGFEGAIGPMDEKIVLTKTDGSGLEEDEELALRSLQTVVLDVSPLSESVLAHKGQIEKVRLRWDPELKIKGLETLKETFGANLEIEKR